MSKQILAAVAVVAVLLAAYFFLTRPEPAKEPGASWSLPELESFDRIAVRRGETEIVIDRAGEGWRIQEPIQFVAAARQMESVVSLFDGESGRPVVDSEKEASANNLTRYGFDEGTLRVTLYDGGQEAASFTVGEAEQTANGATRTWVRPADSDTLYRLNRDLRSVLDRELSEWRDSEVLALSREERDEIDEVELRRGGELLRLTRAAAEGTGEAGGAPNWSLAEPAGIEHDPALIARWVRGLDRLRADDFADDVSLAQAGLESPELELVIHRGDTAQYRLRIGAEVPSESAAAASEGTGEVVQLGTGDGTGEGTGTTAEPPQPSLEQDEPARRYVRLDDGPIFIVSASDAERFIRWTGDFRPREVLSLSQDDIRRIEIADRDGATIVLARNEPAAPEGEGTGEETVVAETEGSWRMEQPEVLDPVDMTEMERILSNIAELEANRFADEVTADAAGLDAPRRVITVTLADGAQHRIEVGHPTEALGEDGESGADHYVRVDGGLVFELRDFKVRHLLKSLEDLRPDAEAVEDEG